MASARPGKVGHRDPGGAADPHRQDLQGESIRKLAETMREKGMLQPLTVIRSGDGYFLIIGERRLWAARFLGLKTVPVRVLPSLERREEILALQLIENLQREDLNPIDMAEALHTFFCDRQGDISLDEILNLLQTYDRDRNRVPEAAAFTVKAIVNITGKSMSSLRRLFAFLKLPEAIKAALRTGQIGLSQGYLFADYLDNPELMQIFNALLAKPVTNEKLNEQLAAYQKTPKRGRPKLYQPFRGTYTSLKAAGATLSDHQAAPVTKVGLMKLLEALRALTTQVETRLQALPPDEVRLA